MSTAVPLSNGAVAGISVGVVVFAALLVVLVLCAAQVLQFPVDMPADKVTDAAGDTGRKDACAHFTGEFRTDYYDTTFDRSALPTAFTVTNVVDAQGNSEESQIPGTYTLLAISAVARIYPEDEVLLAMWKRSMGGEIYMVLTRSVTTGLFVGRCVAAPVYSRPCATLLTQTGTLAQLNLSGQWVDNDGQMHLLAASVPDAAAVAAAAAAAEAAQAAATAAAEAAAAAYAATAAAAGATGAGAAAAAGAGTGADSGTGAGTGDAATDGGAGSDGSAGDAGADGVATEGAGGAAPVMPVGLSRPKARQLVSAPRQNSHGDKDYRRAALASATPIMRPNAALHAGMTRGKLRTSRAFHVAGRANFRAPHPEIVETARAANHRI